MSLLPSLFGGVEVDGRWLVLGVAAQHWPGYLAEAFRVVKPGGYIQMIEYDKESLGKAYSSNNCLPQDSALVKYYAVYSAMTQKMNYGFDLPFIEAELEKLGFADVKIEQLRIPAGPWSEDERLKKVGELCLRSMNMGFEALDDTVSKAIPGMSRESRKAWYNQIGEEMRNPKYRVEVRPYAFLGDSLLTYRWLITARKPE